MENMKKKVEELAEDKGMTNNLLNFIKGSGMFTLSSTIFQRFSPEDYKKVALIILENCPGEAQYLRESFKDDDDIGNLIRKKDSKCLKYMSSRIQNVSSKEDILSVLRKLPSTFKFVSDNYKNDIAIVKEILNLDGLLLEYVSQRLRKDKAVVDIAVKQNKEAEKFAIAPSKMDLIEAYLESLDILPDTETSMNYQFLKAFKNKGLCVLVIDSDNVDVTELGIACTKFK